MIVCIDRPHPTDNHIRQLVQPADSTQEITVDNFLNISQKPLLRGKFTANKYALLLYICIVYLFVLDNFVALMDKKSFLTQKQMNKCQKVLMYWKVKKKHNIYYGISF